MIISKSLKEIKSLLDRGDIKMSTAVKFKFSDGWVDTTAGRLLIWEIAGTLPEKELDKKEVKRLVCYINHEYSPEVAIKRLKRLQDFAYAQATSCALSICYDDVKFDFGVDKKELQDQINNIKDPKKRLKVADEAINGMVDMWFEKVDRNNSLYLMGASGARVSPPQVRSMIVAKGLLTSMSGGISEHPIMESLADGLSPLNYFRTAGPARRGLAGNHFIVPATGYFERQLVNTARNLTIVEEDCGTTNTLYMPARFAKFRFDKDGELITPEFAASRKLIRYRSPVTCESTKGGVCSKCAGLDPATLKPFYNGFGIGTAAGQHIGEPSTQMGLRGKHTSGSTTLADFENSLDNQFAEALTALGGAGTAEMPAHGKFAKTLAELFQEHQDPIKACQEAVKQIEGIYGAIGISIAPVHFETIIRACTDIVEMHDGRKGLRSFGDSGKIIPTTVSKTAVQYPSWLHSLGHGWVKHRLETAVKNNERTYDTVTERLISGRRINDF